MSATERERARSDERANERAQAAARRRVATRRRNAGAQRRRATRARSAGAQRAAGWRSGSGCGVNSSAAHVRFVLEAAVPVWERGELRGVIDANRGLRALGFEQERVPVVPEHGAARRHGVHSGDVAAERVLHCGFECRRVVGHRRLRLLPRHPGGVVAAVVRVVQAGLVAAELHQALPCRLRVLREALPHVDDVAVVPGERSGAERASERVSARARWCDATRARATDGGDPKEQHARDGERGRARDARCADDVDELVDVVHHALHLSSSKMLGGASQMVSMIRVKYNGTKNAPSPGRGAFAAPRRRPRP